MTTNRLPPHLPAALVALTALAGCSSNKSIGLGQGAPTDARFVADLYTWQCHTGSDTATGKKDEIYEGVFAYEVSLEYAPDNLADRHLPASGCTADAELFPTDAGTGGMNLPTATAPRWSNGAMGGEIPNQSAGFYKQEVFADQRTCQDAQELLGVGTELSDAGNLSGAITPAPGLYEGVTLKGDFDENTGIPFGTTLEVGWQASGWDSSWLQVRREQGGSVVQSVTCNTAGSSTFTVDAAVWALLSDALEVDVTNLYVGVQNEDTIETPDGEKVDVTTRAMHVAVVSGG